MKEAPPRVLVVMGVSGSGKSTVARLLADRLGWDFAEGDDLHPRANREKMAAGRALTDEDRWPWLDTIAEWIHERLDAGAPGLVTCSALKRSYRDRLRSPGVVFVHLAGSREVLAGRLDRRTGHFMPTSLLGSQLEALEPLGAGEAGVVVDIGLGPKGIVEEILRELHLGAAGATGGGDVTRPGPPH